MSNNPSTISRGNIAQGWVIAPTLTPLTVATNSVVEQTFTVTGLRLGDYVSVCKPTVTAALGVVNSRVSAADVLAITFQNSSQTTTASPASEVYTILVSRPENVSSNVSTRTVA